MTHSKQFMKEMAEKRWDITRKREKEYWKLVEQELSRKDMPILPTVSQMIEHGLTLQEYLDNHEKDPANSGE